MMNNGGVDCVDRVIVLYAGGGLVSSPDSLFVFGWGGSLVDRAIDNRVNERDRKPTVGRAIFT